MLKNRLQIKIIAMFVLLALSIMIIAGTVLIIRIGNFYSEKFTSEMSIVFSEEQINKELEAATDNENSLKKVNEIVQAFSGSGRLGINKNRNYYILDGKTGKCLESSEINTDNLVKTQNILTAMGGDVGNSFDFDSGVMDYAYPVKTSSGEVLYVVYISDNRAEVKGIIENIFMLLIQVMLWCILISFVLGFFISRNITSPIIKLTRKAEKLAKGEKPDNDNKKKSNDEIGILSDTFNFMSTELFNTLDQIRNEKIKMETILANLTDGVIAFDLDGKVIHINAEARKMLSIVSPDIIDFDLFFKDIDIDIRMGDIVYLNKEKVEEKIIYFNNQVLMAYFVVYKIQDDLGKEKIGGVVVAIQNITKQQKLDEARREFVANVSHELRTPLTTIKSYTETIMDGMDDKEAMEYSFLQVINSEIDRMTRIVKDLLTLSKLDHSDELKKDVFNFKTLLSDVVKRLELEAKKQNHTLTFTATTNIPDYMGDRDKLERVIINIISNSLKYTRNGGKIEVYTGCVYNEIYIKIKDNGIGIPKKDLSRIFERFYRVDKARTRKMGGTGLGLAIAKEIIEKHEGSIKINSEQNKGTEVIITLPLSRKNA